MALAQYWTNALNVGGRIQLGSPNSLLSRFKVPGIGPNTDTLRVYYNATGNIPGERGRIFGGFYVDVPSDSNVGDLLSGIRTDFEDWASEKYQVNRISIQLQSVVALN